VTAKRLQPRMPLGGYTDSHNSGMIDVPDIPNHVVVSHVSLQVQRIGFFSNR